ncbi:MAG: hypothetical protein WC324_02120 [Candidatus Omnitrophota bacterium]|jgi:hypothetical protein
MAYGKTRSTGLTSFVGPPDASGNPQACGTGTKLAVGYNAAGAASVTFTMVGDIQPKGGTPPTGSSYGTALPNTDIIKSAFLVKITTPATPVDVTDKAAITADNQVTLSGITAANASAAYLFVLFDQQDKMGAKN